MHNELGINRGKQFEDVIRRDFLKVPDTVVQRLPDPVQGYLGYRNICDFIIYHYPYQYYIECKSTHSARLSFNNITFNQRVGMLEVAEARGVIAGVICWFVPVDKTYFVPITLIEEYRKEGEKSLNLNKMDTSEWIELKGTKKRVFFEYDIADFIKQCEERYKGYDNR